MKALLIVGVATAIGRAVFAVAADSGIDVGTMIASYGIAAPFAGLCLWQMRSSATKLDAALAKVAELQDDAVKRERDFAGRVAPLLYDSALLYRQGNERLTQGINAPTPAPSDNEDLHRLSNSVAELLRRMGERDPHDPSPG